MKLSVLEPSLQQAAAILMTELSKKGVKSRIIQTYRSLEDQARKFRCTRSLDQIEDKAEYLRNNGRPDLADILINVGPQSRPKWLPKGHLTMAGPGQSKHHKIELAPGIIWCYAFDIACYTQDDKYITDGSADEYQLAGKIGMELGLDWLGKPSSKFKESAHFQMKGLPSSRKRLMLVRG